MGKFILVSEHDGENLLINVNQIKTMYQAPSGSEISLIDGTEILVDQSLQDIIDMLETMD